MNPSSPAITRRGVLAAGGAAIIGAAGGFALGRTTPEVTQAAGTALSTGSHSTHSTAPMSSNAPATIPFYGPHQAGVQTRPALLQTFIGLNLTDPSVDRALAALRLMTDDAARLTAGEPALGDMEPELAAHPRGLTITLGLGRRLFTRIGLPERIPEQLREIPGFATDAFDGRWGQTDLLLQVGSDDAVTLAHATRMLTKDVSTLARVEWMQPGFRSSVPSTPDSPTTRNLLSQPDGVVNPDPNSREFDEVVWIPDGPRDVAGGTVVVLRRIRLLVDDWDALDRTTQELVIGRRTSDGAPLGAARETDPVPFDATDDSGLPVIPADAHVRVAHARAPQERILRRPYNYDDGIRDGVSDMGQIFAAYMRDPATSFIPMQERIAASDAFNRWNTTIGSAAYFLPAGVQENGVLGEGLIT